MLGDRNAGAGKDEGDGRADVEGAGAVTAGAANVHGAGRGRHAHHARQHGADGAGQFRDGFATDAHGHQQAGDLGRGGLARHDEAEGGLGLLGIQGSPGCQAGEHGLEGVHAAAR